MDLVFPFGGLDKASGFQRQRPYTTRSARNVWPRDVFTYEQRGGSRPGLMRVEENRSTASFTGAIRMVNSVDMIDEGDQAHWSDSFRGTTMTGVWAALAGESLPDIYDLSGGDPGVDGGKFASAAYADAAVTRSAMLANPADMVIPSPGGVEERLAVAIKIAPWRGRHWGKYRILMFADNTTPAPTTNGYVFEIDLTGAAGGFTGSATGYLAGVADGSVSLADPTMGSALTGWFVVVYSGSGGGAKFSVSFAGRCLNAGGSGGDVLEGTLNPTTGIITTGRYRCGFQMVAEEEDGRLLVDAFRLHYHRNYVAKTTRTRLLAAGTSASGVFKRMDRGRFVAPTTVDVTLATDVPLQSVEYLQDLYIADYGPVIGSGTDGAISAGGKFQSATYGDFTASLATLTGAIADYAIRIDGYGDFTVSSVATTDITLRESWAQPPNGTTGLEFRIFRGPKRYTSSTDTIGRYRSSTDLGTAPCNCRGISLHGERIVQFADPEAPTNLFFSRNGDPRDYLYGQDDEDPDAPVAIGSSTGGVIGEPVTCWVPLIDDISLIGCTESILVLAGDPVAAGNYDFLSHTIGIVGLRAYAQLPGGPAVVMTQDGLYRATPGGIESISRERLPDALRDLDIQTFNVMLEYDTRHRGIWILVVNRFSAIGRHFWFDWQDQSFWPVDFGSTDIEPTSVCRRKAAEAEDSGILFGCRDGHFRAPERLAINDDGVARTTLVTIGPLNLGAGDRHGVVTNLRGELAGESGDVDWALSVGDTPREALDAAAFASGTFAAGLSRHERPRAGGKAAWLTLSGSTSLVRPWALEKVMLERQTRGGLHRV